MILPSNFKANCSISPSLSAYLWLAHLFAHPSTQHINLRPAANSASTSPSPFTCRTFAFWVLNYTTFDSCLSPKGGSFKPWGFETYKGLCLEPMDLNNSTCSAKGLQNQSYTATCKQTLQQLLSQLPQFKSNGYSLRKWADK